MTSDYADYTGFRDYIKIICVDYADFRDYIKSNFTTDYADYAKDYIKYNSPVITLATLILDTT